MNSFQQEQERQRFLVEAELETFQRRGGWEKAVVADGLNRCPETGKEVWMCKRTQKTVSGVIMGAQGRRLGEKNRVFEAMSAWCYRKDL